MLLVNVIISFFVIIALLFVSPSSKKFDINKSKFLKAILPYGVILGHISAYNTSQFSIAKIGPFIVGVFFFISAYGLECKRQSGEISFSGIWNRLYKILIPLIIPILLYVICLYFKGDNIYEILFENIKNYQLILPFTWFIIILCVFYFIFYLFSSISNQSNGRFLLFTFITVCVFSVINFLLFRKTAAYTNFSCLCFPAGIFYKQYEKHIIYFLEQKMHYIFLILLFLMTGIVTNFNYLLPITILVWSMLIIVLSTIINVQESKLLNFFSQISYEVYVCQGITFLYLPPKFENIPGLIHILITFFLTIIIAMFCHYSTGVLKKFITISDI